MPNRSSWSGALLVGLGLAALIGSATAARSADVDVDVYRVGPPPYYRPANRVVVVTPGPRCYWRVQRVWIRGTLVTRRVRRCV